MHLSFLVPTLDEQAWIGHAVSTLRASLRACQMTGQILVCDGGSRDATCARAEAAGARIIPSSAPGRARQLNAGLAHATGQVVVMPHADLLLGPRQLAAIRTAVDEGAVGGWFEIDLRAERGRFTAANFLRVISAGINLRTRLFHTATADQCLFARREVLVELGGVPELELMEGNALVRKLRQAGPTRVLGPPARLSGRRWEAGGLARTTAWMYVLRAAYMAGVPPEMLARLWR